MNDITVNSELAAQYAAALRDYLAGVEGNPLLRAYRLGRKAIAENLSLSALAEIHEQVLTDFSADAASLGKAWISSCRRRSFSGGAGAFRESATRQ